MHGVGERYKIRHPGGKNGWFRVDCTDPNCGFEATNAYPGQAERRVRAHADAKNANEAEKAKG